MVMKTDRIATVVDQSLIDDFLTEKQRAGWSDSMIKRTRKRLAVFCADFSENPKIVTEGLSMWQKQLEERNLSIRTIKEYTAAAVQFIEYSKIAEVDGYNRRFSNLSGRKFGNLIVLERADGKKSSDQSFLWRCQCSCGKVVEIPADQLNKGLHTSCGCQKAKRLKEMNQYVDGTSLRMVFSDTVRRDNTSGYKGVYLKDGRYAVRIQYKGKRYYLGTFEHIEDAISERKEAEEKIREACQAEYLHEAGF